MKAQLITPEKILFEGEAQMVTAPGVEGEFGVLDGHAPFVSTLRPGVITIDLEGGEQKKIMVTGGIAEVVPERVTILIESASDASGMSDAEIDTKVKEMAAAA